jgi:hypothetical protein
MQKFRSVIGLMIMLVIFFTLPLIGCNDDETNITEAPAPTNPAFTGSYSGEDGQKVCIGNDTDVFNLVYGSLVANAEGDGTIDILFSDTTNINTEIKFSTINDEVYLLCFDKSWARGTYGFTAEGYLVLKFYPLCDNECRYKIVFQRVATAAEK